MTFEVLTALVLMNLLSTFALWRVALQKPERLKKKFLSALLHSGPIVPQHQPPKAAVGSMAQDADRQFFDDFQDFANVMDWWWAADRGGGPWRLQELPETDLKLRYTDMPVYGRRYSIFHNQVSLGTLEMSPGLHYSAETPGVLADIELDWVRLLTSGTICLFLYDIASHICDDTDADTRAQAAINGSLTAVLWDTQQISEIDLGQDYSKLELRLRGLASSYFHRRRALRNQSAAE
jgi:hypothetical protein